jgi:hypothetical protein
MKYPQLYLSRPPEIHATLSCPFWLGPQSQGYIGKEPYKSTLISIPPPLPTKLQPQASESLPCL